jgi:hypothetical protein
MANGPAPTGLPWLQPLATFTTQVGVPTVFAGVLLWFLLTRVSATMETIKQNEELRTQMMAVMQAGFSEAIDRQTVAFERATAIQTTEFVRALQDATRRDRPRE